MNANTTKQNDFAIELKQEQASEVAIRELMESELMFVGGGNADVVWNTPNP
jgi:hypothetical protein